MDKDNAVDNLLAAFNHIATNSFFDKIQQASDSCILRWFGLTKHREQPFMGKGADWDMQVLEETANMLKNIEKFRYPADRERLLKQLCEKDGEKYIKLMRGINEILNAIK